jgi:hypothetical protein
MSKVQIQFHADPNESLGMAADGSCDDEGLRESALGGATDDRETLRVWRRVIKHARSEMHVGASIRNPQTGAMDRIPDHRHTSGAHELARQGVKMLAAAGWNEFEFDDCPA